MATDGQAGSEPRLGNESMFVNSRGLRIQTKVWLPDNKPIGMTVFLHGWRMNSTSNAAWQRVADAHTSNGLLCAGLDFPGHGRSGGEKQYLFLDPLRFVVDDVLEYLDQLREQHPDLPVFLRGQSLGGLVGIMTALARPDLITGLAIGAPPIELGGLFGLLSRWTPVGRHAIPAAARYANSRLGDLTVPLAVFQGVDDGTCSASGAVNLVRHAAARDKSLYFYKDMGHNMSIEPDVLAWLLPRASATASAEFALPEPRTRLCVRSPLPGVPWPPPPGAASAAAHTQLEAFELPDEQCRALQTLIGDSSPL